MEFALGAIVFFFGVLVGAVLVLASINSKNTLGKG
jgi:hypothetical protein